MHSEKVTAKPVWSDSFLFNGTPENLEAFFVWCSQWDVHTTLKDPRTGAEYPMVEEYVNQWIVSTTVLKYAIPHTVGVGKIVVDPGEIIVRYPDGFVRVMTKQTYDNEFTH